MVPFRQATNRKVRVGEFADLTAHSKTLAWRPLAIYVLQRVGLCADELEEDAVEACASTSVDDLR